MTMLVDLKGRHALVTGGGTGIGSALCIGLARCGATVVVNYSRSEKGAEETVESIKAEGGRAIAVKADLTDEDQVEQLVDTSLREFGGLHILVANAGGPTEHKPTVDLEEEDWNRGMGINCKSVFYCVKHTVPYLPDITGRIIVNSSGSARSGAGPEMITYAASKGAVNNMVRGWAKEYGARGITVNAIAPGPIWTRIFKGNIDQKAYDEIIARSPLGRFGEPEDCVGPVLLLASDDGSYINGQVIEVGGGIIMPS